MSDPQSYDLKGQMTQLISQLGLTDVQQQSMQGRWLDQLLWLEKRATQCRNWYYRLRLMTIIGGVIVPALVSLTFNVNGEDQANLKRSLMVGTFFLSQMVAISVAVEEFFHYGDRFRQYRNTAEAMKIEGWQFIQLTGAYRHATSHQESYGDFAERVEGLIQQDVETFINMLAQLKNQSSSEVSNQLLLNAQPSDPGDRPHPPVEPSS